MLQARHGVLSVLRLAVLFVASSAFAFDVPGSPFGSISVEVGRDPQNANSVQVRTVSRQGELRQSGQPYDVRLRILRTSEGASVTLASFSGQGTYNEGGLVASYSVSGTAYLWFNVWNYNDGVAAEAIVGPVTVDAGGSVNLPPALQYAGSFSIPGNTTDHPIVYNVTQGGVPRGSIEQAPGAPPIVLNIPGLQSGVPLHLTETTPGVKATPGGGFESDPGGPGYTRDVGTVIPTQSSGGGGSTPAPVVSPTAPTQPASGGTPVAPAPAVTVTVGDGAIKPVWVPKADVAPGTTPGQSTSDFTIAAYREGVDREITSLKSETQRVVTAIQTASAAQSTRDGVRDGKIDGVGAKIDGLGGKLDTANGHLAEIRAKTTAEAQSSSEALAELRKLTARDAALGEDTTARVEAAKSAATAQVVLQKTAAETAFATEWDAKLGTEPVPGETVTGGLGGGEWPTVEIPLLGTIVFSPFVIPWLGPIMTGCREIILILLCVAFVRLQFERANKYELAVMTVNPPVPTQTVVENVLPIGGQILAWAKGAITALVVVQVAVAAYAAAVFVMDTHLMGILGSTWRALVSGSGWVATHLGESSGNAWWDFALSFFPLDAFMKLLFADVICLFSMGKLFLLASSVVKFVRA